MYGNQKCDLILRSIDESTISTYKFRGDISLWCVIVKIGLFRLGYGVIGFDMLEICFPLKIKIDVSDMIYFFDMTAFQFVFLLQRDSIANTTIHIRVPTYIIVILSYFY